eukprot:CAMPEP_0171701688 /NCGR_PEP_ID=MMETSP0991-20121206/11200_1 /TAXON_ID=483369 /ORGANISM="non described non described, Strain CCMP2098" /LENGTH=61 /DNA_ID=CAMNT_0012290989 /DNA_START=496 /DNA_END=681 /DNA_ORIENTATION=-
MHKNAAYRDSADAAFIDESNTPVEMGREVGAGFVVHVNRKMSSTRLFDGPLASKHILASEG